MKATILYNRDKIRLGFLSGTIVNKYLKDIFYVGQNDDAIRHRCQLAKFVSLTSCLGPPYQEVLKCLSLYMRAPLETETGLYLSPPPLIKIFIVNMEAKGTAKALWTLDQPIVSNLYS